MRQLEVLGQGRPRSSPMSGGRRIRAGQLQEALAAVSPTEEANDLGQALDRFSERCLVHAFRYRDRQVLLDPVTGTLFDLSDGMYAVAEAISVGLHTDDLARAVQSAGVDEARLLLRDVTQMDRQFGMFRRDRLQSGGAIEGYVKGLMDSHPRKMMLCVSQTCNLRCVYCYAIEGNYHDEGKLMSLETAQQSLRYLAQRAQRRKSLTVTLFGGEPLINFEMIKKLVPWAESWGATIGKRVHFSITTNGTLLSDEVIDFLITHKFSVMISLDGPQEVQDLTRPMASGKGSFMAAVPKIKRLLERHPHPEIVKVRATMTHQSHDSDVLMKFFEGVGFKRASLGANVGYAFYKGPFDLTDDDREELYFKTERFVDEHLDDVVRHGKKVAYDPIGYALAKVDASMDEAGPMMKIPCGVGRNDQGVDVDGNVYPCHRYVGMKAYVIGDVWKGLERESLVRYYRSILRAYDACDSCWATRWCAGHCSNYLSDPTGTSYGPDEPACDNIRANLERTVALYTKYAREGASFSKIPQDV